MYFRVFLFFNKRKMRIFTKAQEILANDENRNQETEFCLKKLKRRITKEAMRLDGEDGTGLEEHHEGDERGGSK